MLNDGRYSLENKEISIKTGVEINNEIEYQKLGTYTIPKLELEQVTSNTNFTSYDHMKKFDIPYADNNRYPIRTDDYLNNLCLQVGLILGSKDFPNNDYMIKGNPFTNGETCRTVLSNISQLTGGFVEIDMEDEKVYIRNFDIKGEPVETIDGNNYTEFNPNEVFGPVNSICIKMNSGIDGEESVREDIGLTDETRCQITISDNYFLTSAEERELVIDNIYKALYGLTYLPVEISYYGYPWLKLGDKIKVKDKKDNEYVTYIMEHTFKYNGAYSGTIKSMALTKTQSAYKSIIDLKTWKRNTESSVDKINGKIKQLVQETGKYEEKITKVEQDVNSINQQVSEMADLTRIVIENNEVHITEAMPVEPENFRIYGNSEYFKYLYPTPTLCPSPILYPVGDYFTICVDKNNRNNPSVDLKEIRINLKEPLRSLENIHDEFVISNVDNIAKVIRRIGINSDGSLYLLENETEEVIREVKLTLFEGENYIYVKEFNNLKYEIEYAVLNEFTKNFATNIEVNSKIEQTSTQIMQQVNKKVDEEEFGIQLTLNYEALQLAWNQISQYLKLEGIAGKATFNIYDENNSILMSLSSTGQKFFRQDGTEIGDIGLLTDKDNKNFLVFSLNTESASDGMAWGIKNSKGQFFPIFQMVSFDYSEQSEYGGYLQMVATLDMLNNEIKLLDSSISAINIGGVSINNANLFHIIDENRNIVFEIEEGGFNLCNGKIKFYYNPQGSYTLNMYNNSIMDADTIFAKTVSATDVIADTVVETSVKKRKKYIKKIDKNALKIINNSDIYQYQLKGEKANGHRHYGLVIDEGSNYPDEVVADNKKGIEIYSMTSIAWKAIQELSQRVEKLENELKEVKNEKNTI